MPQYYGWGLPIDISTHGAEIDRIICVIHVGMALLFVGWLSYLVFALVRFRRRSGHQSSAYKPPHFKLPTYVEVAVAVTEAVLLLGFSFPVVYKISKVFPPEKESLRVRVVAEQFAWNVHYPGEDGVFGKTDIHLISPVNPVGLDAADAAAKDDVVTINQLHIPVNKAVIADLASKDVIHSFALPVMRVKRDVIPGQKASVWFQAKQTGNFEIACAQLCGLGHYRMRGFFIVETQEQFDAWLKQMAPAAVAPVAAAVPAPVAAGTPSSAPAAAGTPASGGATAP